jgi:hypothetical protein
MGNLTNCCVILICMAIFGETGPTLTFSGSQKVLALTYGFGAVSCLVMVWYRAVYLHESKVGTRWVGTCATEINRVFQIRPAWAV